MKKTIMFVFMLLACLLVMPSVHAETTAEEDYAKVKVEDITNEDTLKTDKNGVLTGKGTDNITLTYEQAAFELLSKGSIEERPDQKAFIGIRVTLPTEAQNIKVKTISPEHTDSLEGTTTFDKYFGFDANDFETAVKDGKNSISRSYEVTWDTERKITVNLVVKLEQIEIYEENKYEDESSEPKWNEDKYLETSDQIKLTIGVVYSGEGVGDSYTKSIYVAKGKEVPTEAELRKAIKEEIGKNYDVEGFYSDVALKTKFDFSKNKTFEENTTIYIQIVDAKKTQPSEANPKTGDSLMTYVAMASVAVVATLGTGLYLRKANN